MKLKYNSYSNLPIGKYYEILEISKREVSDIEKDIAIIAVLCEATEDQVYKLKPAEVYELQQQLSFLASPATNLKKSFSKLNIGDKKYKVVKDLDDLNISQYIDFQFSWNGDYIDNLPQILSVFIIPEGCKYNEGYDIAEVQEEIKNNLSVDTALQIAFFLRKKSVNLTRARLLYFRLMLKWMTWKQKNPEIKAKMKELQKQCKMLESNLTTGYL